jgi:predicted nucleotidyltransferase
MKGNGEEGITLKGNLMVLKEVMAKFEDVKLAYLFGSYAEGRAMPASDIDIAVLTKKRGVIPYLSAEISNALNIPEERISILNLDDITPKILLRILVVG